MNKLFLLILVAMLALSVSAGKIHPNLESVNGDVRVLVQFVDHPGKAENALLKGHSCEIEYVPRHMNLIIASCPGNKLNALANANIVQFVWEDEFLEPTLDVSAPQISAPAAWNNGYNGSGVKISLIDTGVNSSHPAFQGRIVLEKDFTTDNNTGDFCDHGTHTASVMVSVNDTYKGIAHGASLLNAKAGTLIPPNPGCGFSASKVMQAIDWSIDNNANLIALITGSPISNCSLSITAAYVNKTVVEDNIQIIVPAGNGGPGNTSIWTPGCAESAITVGAVDDNNQIASFSSRGPVIEEITHIKPDVVAPGVGIISAHYNGLTFDSVDGTSISTPHAAGVVALILQAQPGLNHSQIKEIIKNTAVDLGYDEITQGKGLVNASAAVDLALNTTPVPPVYPDFPGIFAYFNGNSFPRFRDVLSDDTLSAENTAADVGQSFVWIRTATSPVKDEDIIVTQDEADDINVQIRRNNKFRNVLELTANAGGINQRRFDVAYELNSGKAMIVYGNNSAVPGYQIWNGSEYTQNGALASSDCTGTVAWIALSSKPNSSEIVAMYHDSNGDYCGQVWNGSSWGNTKKFGTSSGISTQKFDIVHEQSSGHALAVLETSTAGVLGYCAWDGSSWCSTVSTLQDRGDLNDWVKLAPQLGSDRIMVGIYQFGNGKNPDVEAVEWNGTAFGTWKLVDSKTEGASDVGRIVDVAYIGTTGKALIVYDDDNSKVPSYATCASSSDCFAGTWSSVATTTSSSNNCGEAVDLDYIGLAEDPLSDKVLLYAITQTNHYKCAQIFDGTSWGSWYSNLSSGSVSDSEDVSASYDLI